MSPAQPVNRGVGFKPEECAKVLPRCREIACRAAEAIEERRKYTTHVSAKADGSPVTGADRASHQVIVPALEKLTPEVPVISEESSEERPDAVNGMFWLVDPLDGTKEFIKGLPEYTVNIALISDGEPILGVVHIPTSGESYYAAKEAGAWKQTGEGEPQRIQAGRDGAELVAVASRSHMSDETRAFLDRLSVQEIIRRGSSLKMCSVAEGVADIYPRLGPTYLWDTAAGAAVARTAGCTLLDLNGAEVSYDLQGDLLLPGFVLFAAAGPLAEGVARELAAP